MPAPSSTACLMFSMLSNFRRDGYVDLVPPQKTVYLAPDGEAAVERDDRFPGQVPRVDAALLAVQPRDPVTGPARHFPSSGYATGLP